VSVSWQPTERDLIAFVYREARLLDGKQYGEWYELFDDDGRYWVPLSGDQTDPVGQQSIAYEDKLLLRVRLERLKSAKVYAHQPPIACQHVLQEPNIEKADHQNGEYVLRTPFVYVEAQHSGQLILTGSVLHQLRVRGNVLRIVVKRVDLLNANAAQPAIYLFP